MSAHPRTILHVDMDAFFASVEQRDNPALRGVPVIVGGTGGRGVVCAASYEARPFGCRSAMPMSQALRLCPHAIVVPVRGGHYRDVSRQVFTILERFTDRVQPVSVDEAFLDVTGCQQLFGPGPTIARMIRHDIQRQLQLTASVGVAPNKFLAKLASDLNKPDGLTVITPDTIDTILPPLSVGRIWGVGAKTADRLARLGIKTIADLRTRDARWFCDHLGAWGERIKDLIHGIDERPVESDGDAQSVGHEHTFGANATDPDFIRSTLLDQAQDVGTRLRRYGLFAGTVQVKIRYGDFVTTTRSRQLPVPTDVTTELYTSACDVFNTWAAESFQPVRLIGLQAQNLSREPQLDLFSHVQTEKLQKVDRTLDAIQSRFGKDVIRRAK